MHVRFSPEGCSGVTEGSIFLLLCIITTCAGRLLGGYHYLLRRAAEIPYRIQNEAENLQLKMKLKMKIMAMVGPPPQSCPAVYDHYPPDTSTTVICLVQDTCLKRLQTMSNGLKEPGNVHNCLHIFRLSNLSRVLAQLTHHGIPWDIGQELRFLIGCRRRTRHSFHSSQNYFNKEMNGLSSDIKHTEIC